MFNDKMTACAKWGQEGDNSTTTSKHYPDNSMQELSKTTNLTTAGASAEIRNPYVPSTIKKRHD